MCGCPTVHDLAGPMLRGMLFCDLEEWETQKYRTTGLNDLECETEVIHRDCVISQQDTKECADSKEATTQELPLD